MSIGPTDVYRIDAFEAAIGLQRLVRQGQLDGGGRANRVKSAGEVRCMPAHFLKHMHNKKMFDLENEGQGHGVQQWQRSLSMANINLYKSHT